MLQEGRDWIGFAHHRAPARMGRGAQKCRQQLTWETLRSAPEHRPGCLTRVSFNPAFAIYSPVTLDKSLLALEVVFHTVNMGSWHVEGHYESAISQIQDMGNCTGQT